MKVLRKIAVSVLVGLFLIGICYAQNTAMEIYLTGMEYAVKGDFKEAKEQFEKALKIDPFFRNAKECLEPIEDVINQKISNEMAIYIFKGVTYSNKDMFNKAIVECNQAIAIDPKYGSVYNDRGLVFLFKGEYDRAISDFNKIIEINPRYTIAYVNRGCVYEKKGQYDRALADYTKAIEIDPRNIEAYNNRGLIYGKYKSQFDNSIVEFTKAIEIDPRNAEVYENRAVSYYCKGEYDKAWEDVHKAQDLGHQVSPQLLRLLNDTSGLQK